MSVDRLRQVLSGHRLLFLDTMVFSYQLANHPTYAPLTSAILEAIESGQVAGLTSTVTLAEILTVPAKAQDRRAMRDYELYLTHFPNLMVVSLDATAAREMALVRAATGLRTPDAIQVATARTCRADAIVTNDRRWAGRVVEPALVMLEDYVT